MSFLDDIGDAVSSVVNDVESGVSDVTSGLGSAAGDVAGLAADVAGFALGGPFGAALSGAAGEQKMMQVQVTFQTLSNFIQTIGKLESEAVSNPKLQ